MRALSGEGIRALALAACIFESFAVCKPVAAPASAVSSFPAITTLTVGNLPPQTVTASNQIVYYYDATTTTTMALTCPTPGTYTQGCFTTVISEPGIYNIESPQRIDTYCPYEVFELFSSCPLCQKDVVAEYCQFGYCDWYLFEYLPVNPTSTQTFVIQSTLGCNCTSWVAGGGGYPTMTPPLSTTTPLVTWPPMTSLLPTTTITSTITSGTGFTTITGGTVIVVEPSAPLPTVTSYFTGLGSGSTTTIGNSVVVVSLPYVTKTLNLPPNASGYTSFASGGTEIIGSPLPTVVISYIITTSYFTSEGSGFTTTVGSSVIVGLPFSSITVTLPATANPFTSTESGGTIVYGSPSLQPTTTKTTYLASATVGFTQTVSGTEIDGIPYITSTICSGVTAPYTSTSGGVIILGSVPPTITIMATIPAGSPAYSSLRHANSCSVTGTLVIFSPMPFVTTTSYLDHGEPGFTETEAGTVIVGVQVPTLTVTSALSAGIPGYTSIISASGSVDGTVVVGQTRPYITETSYLDNGGIGYTSTIDGSVIIGSPVSTLTITSTLSAGIPGYTSTISASVSVDGTVVIGQTQPYIIETSYLDNGGTGYTSTIKGSVIIGFPVPTLTIISTLSAGISGYTSIMPASGSLDGTVFVGQTQPYIIETSYLDNGGAGYTSTLGGSIIIGFPVSTYTIETTLSAGNSPFTTTILASGSVPGTVIIATPAPYISVTSYFTGGGSAHTTTTQGSIIIYEPYVTVTNYVNTATGGVAGTFTNGATLTVDVPYSYATSYFASPGSAYTTTISGTIVYVTAFVTTTSYLYSSGEGTTITSGGSIIIVTDLPTVTITDFLGATGSFSGSAGPVYTSTIPAEGMNAGTVIVGFVQPIVTIYTTFGSIQGTQTVSASGTIAGTVIITEPTACGNAGFEMGVYQYPSDTLNDDDTTFSDFDPTIYKTLALSYPEDTSTSPYFNCPVTGANVCTIANATTPLPVTPTYVVINYRGYFIPPITGAYNFTTKYVDDILLLWLGPFAYAGWTRSNAALLATYGDYPGDNQVHSYTVILVAGQYYPIRIMFSNAQGPGIFELDVSSPNGQSVSFNGSNLVGFSCDGILGPVYPPYGQET